MEFSPRASSNLFLFTLCYFINFELVYWLSGQPMSVSFYIAPRAPRRTASAPSTTARSLLNRVEKPPLAERLTKEEADAKPPSGP